MLPPLQIATAGGCGQNPCLICGKELKDGQKHKWVVLSDGLDHVVDPEMMEQGLPNGGGFPIGLGCWRKHPELKPYEAKNFLTTPKSMVD